MDFKFGDATQRAQKRESFSIPWRSCRGRMDSNPFPLDRAQKVGPETCVTQSTYSYMHYLQRYQGGGGHNLPPQKKPYISQKKGQPG